MNMITGKSHVPLLILHGGAGPMDPSVHGVNQATDALEAAALQAMQAGPRDLQLVVRGLEQLEDDPLFNAGFGAALQADGKPRLTAALMNGAWQNFSAVISISDIRHPSQLAWALQDASSRVLTGPGHEALAKELKLKTENLIHAPRLEAWKKNFREAAFSSDTVGVLVWNGADLYAGTSTGGRGFEEPGRVSDSGTVAGTYASPFAAVSATGIGEEIVDDAVAARIETRVRDGMSLEQASAKTLEEAARRHRSYGWIACDAEGSFAVAYTTDVMSYLVMDWEGRILASSRRPMLRS